jgi:hypothetical protein
LSSSAKNSRWLLIAVTIAREQQLGVGHQPAQYLLDALVFGDYRGEHAARHGGQLSLVGRRECDRRLFGLGEIGLDRGAFRSGIEIAQIPGWQILLDGRLAGGGVGRGCVAHRCVPQEAAVRLHVR